MMTDGLACEIDMPLAWRPATLDLATRQSRIRAAALLLSALNQMESSHEAEAGSPENRRLERIEAKLDLTLHLLARVLDPDELATPRKVRLGPDGAQWPDPAPPPAGTTVLLVMRPSEVLPLNLELPAVAREPLAGEARVGFEDLSEALDAALYQFVFRRHRQAIRARGG
jgi:hypothetical protein